MNPANASASSSRPQPSAANASFVRTGRIRLRTASPRTRALLQYAWLAPPFGGAAGNAPVAPVRFEHTASAPAPTAPIPQHTLDCARGHGVHG